MTHPIVIHISKGGGLLVASLNDAPIYVIDDREGIHYRQLPEDSPELVDHLVQGLTFTEVADPSELDDSPPPNNVTRISQ